MTISIQSILCPTDFSDSADHALKYGIEFAKRFDAMIHLHHAINVPVVSVAYEIGADVLAARGAAETQAKQLLAERTAQLEQQGIRAESHLTIGAPFIDIITLARDQKIDLIIMGTHGKGAIEHLLMGSTTERVVRKAPCPVLTVKDAGAPAGE